jgi:CRISPR/Cas system endoribonuclease Cas6 (RAMP superfamily)
MRIKILLSKTNIELPIQHQSIVNSFIHKVLGPNNKYHNAKNNYSISSLQGGKWIPNTNNISFNNGGYITISSLNKEFIDDVLVGLYTTPFYKDISVSGIEFIDEQFYNGWNHFVTLSPFLIKEYSSKKNINF